MKMSIYRLAGLIAAVSAVLCSCGTPSDTPGETAATTVQSAVVSELSEKTEDLALETDEPDLGTAGPATRGDYIHYACSSVSHGDPTRFRRVFEKAANGEEITVAYIGGSITEGYTLKPDECWAYLTHRWLCEKYPAAKINYVNAGLSGTPSTLGLIRAERDVIAPHGDPDIVFIEFAVNDDGSHTTKEAYESLVRKMLDLKSAPAVALVFMRTDNGYSCQNWQKEVGYLYGLPMISINDALTKAIEDGYMTWADYSDDGAHPNPEGSRFVADAVEYMFGLMADPATQTDKPGLSENDRACDIVPVYGSDFVNMHLADAASLEPVSSGEYSIKSALGSFPNAWTRKGGENEGITFDMTFDDLFIVYHCNNSKAYGTAEVYVDGELKTEVNSFSKEGWSNPVPQLIMRGEKTEQHKVEVKMKGSGEKEYFSILAFGFTD